MLACAPAQCFFAFAFQGHLKPSKGNEQGSDSFAVVNIIKMISLLSLGSTKVGASDNLASPLIFFNLLP